MGMRDVARDAETKSVTGLLGGEAEVGFEYLLEPGFRHPRPFIINMQNEGSVTVFDKQMGTFAILQRVVQQVADAALERQRLAGIGCTRPALNRDAAVASSRQLRLGDAIEQQI